ncbi:MAG TPA: heterodisulfide reductase-related iron-sulfur binding cluster, partial [Prolixibacteraceae bacterium]|nr:heterodisulfide reductase-related iron-sulfur binding cluster [Prolixibacteraceae bacterium]
LFHSSSLRMSYHDPCDLGRGSGIYEEPREILRHTGTLVPVPQEREDALCCGGSLANLAITPRQRQQVTDAAYAHLTAEAPDFVVTSCPLCKKTFAAGKRPVPVIDIAEALAFSMTGDTVPTRLQKSTRELVAP